MCLCLSASTNTNTHTHTRTGKHTKPCCGQTHPSLLPHLEKPQNQTHASLFQLPFFPPSSPHRIYLNSPTVSLFFPPFSLISNVSMCCHHKRTPTHTHTHTHTFSHTAQSGNHNKHIKALKPQFMADDLLNRLQLTANNCKY